jgi:FkbM family methyltransferase
MNKELGLLQKLIRLYTFYSPIRKGKYRLSLFAMKLTKKVPEEVLAISSDGRRLWVNLKFDSQVFTYFLGEYEPVITNTIRTIIKPTDICLDIGANIGWYTTLLQKNLGKHGEIHSFEPVPPTFKVLEKNVKLNDSDCVVNLNNCALGESEKEVRLNLFENLPDGHASISDYGRTDIISFDSQMTTIDTYLSNNKVGEVTFIKADIEGSELSMLKGASKLFSQKRPPIFEIEMALDTTQSFNYTPNDLIDFINTQVPYDFYAIDEDSGTLRKIEGFAPDHRGANVLCVPNGFYQERLSKLNLKN